MMKAILSVVLICAAGARAQDGLPPKVLADLLKQRFVEAVEAEDHEKTLGVLKDLRATGQPLGTEVFFFEARALLTLGRGEEADKALKNYLVKGGESAPHYAEALSMMSKRMEEKEGAARAEKDRAEAPAKLKASLIRLGKIERVDEKWGYAVVKLEGESAKEKENLLIYAPDSELPVTAAAGKTKNDSLTVTVTELSKTPVGSEAFRLTQASYGYLQQGFNFNRTAPAAAPAATNMPRTREEVLQMRGLLGMPAIPGLPSMPGEATP